MIKVVFNKVNLDLRRNVLSGPTKKFQERFSHLVFLNGQNVKPTSKLYYHWLTKMKSRFSIRNINFHPINSYSSKTKDYTFYEAPFASVLIKLKRVSIVTSVLSSLCMPCLLYFQISAPLPAKLAIFGVTLTTSIGSTLALDYFFKPYVHSLQWAQKHDMCRSTPKIMAINYNIFAQKEETYFVIQDVRKISRDKKYRPFYNLRIKGKPMYIHLDSIHDKKALSHFQFHGISECQQTS